MDRRTAVGDHFMHAGSGTSIAFAYLGLIPRVIPLLALTVLVVAMLALPVVVLGLASIVVALPPYAVWRFVTSRRRH